jgi:proline racemase
MALTLSSVEVHAAGEPARVVVDAADLVRGDTMPERLEYCRRELDGLRRLLLHEPRGYPGLCAVLLTPPVEPGSDVGIVVLEQGGFTPMSGSNTICAVTALIEDGRIPVTAPVMTVTLDTAVGTVRAEAVVRDGRVTSVTVANVPAYVVALDRKLDLSEYGTVPADIVFGGQFFAQVRAADLGLELDPARGRELVRAGAAVRAAALEQVEVSHPEHPGVGGVSLVMLHSGDRVPGEVARNTVVLTTPRVRPDRPETWTGTLDRSPCGTGTSARMAALHARGQLAVGESFPHRSVLGTEFVGRLRGTTTVAGRPAVLPSITGRAWVTGRATWVLDDTDPFPAGYTLGDLWPPD